MQQNKGCPICGSEGTEVRRRSVVHDEKLCERVTMVCQHTEASITWSVYDDAIRIEANKEAKEFIHGGHRPKGYRRKIKKHPESVASGESSLADVEVDVVPTVEAIVQLEKRKPAKPLPPIDKSNIRDLIRRSVRKYGS